VLRPQDLPEGFGAAEDTWYFPRICGTFKERSGWHGCQMPEQLLGRIIRASSREGETVIDPFAGSGTTLAVAKKLGRSFLGMELSEDYADRVNTRLAGISAGDPLDGAAEPLKTAPATKDGRRLDARGKKRPSRAK
jgi:site-specific DNA-methyltransferase (adenine-specific)